jgi:hypothetical protein
MWVRRAATTGLLFAGIVALGAWFALMRKPEVLRDSRRRAELRVYYGGRVFGAILMLGTLWYLAIPFVADLVLLGRDRGPQRILAEVYRIEVSRGKSGGFSRRVWLRDDRRPYDLYFFFGPLSSGEIRIFTVLPRSRLIVDVK